MRARPVLRWSIAVLLLALAACQSDARRAQQARVANLAARLDRLRQADNPDKAPLLEDLKLVECVEPDACALKELCVEAYMKHQSSLNAMTEAKALLAATGRGETIPTEVISQRVSLAQRDLTTARELGEKCAHDQVMVVRKVLMP